MVAGREKLRQRVVWGDAGSRALRAAQGANVLVSDSGVVKLADFGCSRKLHKGLSDWDSSCASFGKVSHRDDAWHASALSDTRCACLPARCVAAGGHALLHGARGTGEGGSGAWHRCLGGRVYR